MKENNLTKTYWMTRKDFVQTAQKKNWSQQEIQQCLSTGIEKWDGDVLTLVRPKGKDMMVHTDASHKQEHQQKRQKHSEITLKFVYMVMAM